MNFYKVEVFHLQGIYNFLTRGNEESSFCSHALAQFVPVIGVSFICVVVGNPFILLDIKIGLPHYHVHREI